MKTFILKITIFILNDYHFMSFNKLLKMVSFRKALLNKDFMQRIKFTLCYKLGMFCFLVLETPTFFFHIKIYQPEEFVHLAGV